MKPDILYERGKLVYEYQQQGLTNAEIQELLGLNHERRVREAASYYARKAALPYPLRINQHAEARPEISFDAQTAATEDWLRWNDWLKNFRSPYMRVAILNDLHLGGERNTRALDIVYQVLEDFCPHVISDGSDVFDFPTISRHPQHPADLIKDIWSQSKAEYLEHRNMLHRVAPGHKAYYLSDNHGDRIFEWASTSGLPFYDLIIGDFVETVRGSGTYWFDRAQNIITIGDKFAHVHGRKLSGRTPAQQLWNKFGHNFQVTVAGHVHRDDEFYPRGNFAAQRGVGLSAIPYYADKGAFTTGCLCRLRPNWDNDVEGMGWRLGFGVVLIETSTGTPYYQHVKISLDYKCVFGGRIYA